MGRRFARVQRDGDFGLLLVIEVDHRRCAVALLDGVEVGADEVAVHLPAFTVGAVLQLLVLQRKLAGDAVGGVRQNFEQVGAAVAHPLDAVPLGVEVVEQLAVSRIGSGEHHAAVLVDVHEGKIHRLFAGVDDAGGGAGVIFCQLNHPRQKEAQAVEVVGGHLGDDPVVAGKDVVCNLAADDGGHALHRSQQRFGKRGVLALAQPLFDLLRGAVDQIQLVLRRRQGVADTG